ncbi:fasciclin-like arabinogalactan family protein [Actinidia rufa]|uniref:Fasciclin-like arabinogalactan family protein n=1 Tax=Actinidia rufa TaxID=165716 RepID=A0A7J0H4J5_9ERIC|nr:fasciclin-like arabinogalactan family protein [Actinidia rufa]
MPERKRRGLRGRDGVSKSSHTQGDGRGSPHPHPPVHLIFQFTSSSSSPPPQIDGQNKNHGSQVQTQMATPSISHFTPIPLIYLLLFSYSIPILAINITTLLSPYPDLSDFSALLTTTAVAADLTQRSSLTLLAVPNSFLRSSSVDLNRPPPRPPRRPPLPRPPRVHLLVGPPPLNITRDPATGAVVVRSPAAAAAPSNATVLSLIKTIPYNLTILSVNSLLVPFGFDLTASETRPSLGLNITKALIDGHNFNVAASMLAASGVADEFEQDEGGAGITMFVPTDDAFSDLPATANFQSLPADDKVVVLKFHVLHSYYPLGSLESIVNPVQPTLATEVMGAGKFTLNISRVNDSVGIDTGIVQASVTQTVLDQNPVAIFGVSKVLLPREIFGKNPIVIPKPGGEISGGAQPPDPSLSPENSPEFYPPPSRLSSPPGFREEIRSEATGSRRTEPNSRFGLYSIVSTGPNVKVKCCTPQRRYGGVLEVVFKIVGGIWVKSDGDCIHDDKRPF